MSRPETVDDASAGFTLVVLSGLLLATASCVNNSCSRSDAAALSSERNSAVFFDKATLGRWSMTSCLLASRVQYAMRASKEGTIDADQLYRVWGWDLDVSEKKNRGAESAARTVQSRYKKGWCISIVELDPEHRSSFYEYTGMIRVLLIEGDGPAPWTRGTRWRTDLKHLRVGVHEDFEYHIGNLEGLLDPSSNWIRHERELLAVQEGELVIERQPGRPDSCYAVRVKMRGAMRESLIHRSEQRNGRGLGPGRFVTKRTRFKMDRNFRGLDLQAPIPMRVPRTGLLWVRPSWRDYLASRIWPSPEGAKITTSSVPAGIKQSDWLLHKFKDTDIRPLLDWDQEKKAGIK